MTATNFITTYHRAHCLRIGNGIFHPSPNNHCSLENGFPRYPWHNHHPPPLAVGRTAGAFPMNESGSNPSTPGTPMTQCPLRSTEEFCFQKFGWGVQVVMLCTCLGALERERERERASKYLSLNISYLYYYTTRLKLIYGFGDSLCTMYCIGSI